MKWIFHQNEENKFLCGISLISFISFWCFVYIYLGHLVKVINGFMIEIQHDSSFAVARENTFPAKIV